MGKKRKVEMSPEAYALYLQGLQKIRKRKPSSYNISPGLNSQLTVMDKVGKTEKNPAAFKDLVKRMTKLAESYTISPEPAAWNVPRRLVRWADKTKAKEKRRAKRIGLADAAQIWFAPPPLRRDNKR